MASKFFSLVNRPTVKGLTCKGGLTQQHFKDDCDLNLILRRFKLGVPPPSSEARFEDLTEAPVDLQDAFDRVRYASEWFDSLPSDVRSKYHNDPQEAVSAILHGSSADLAVLFPNHSKAAAAATPEPHIKAAKGGEPPPVETQPAALAPTPAPAATPPPVA